MAGLFHPSKRHSPFAITFCMFVPRTIAHLNVDRQGFVLARQCRKKKRIKGALGKNGGRRQSALHNGSSVSYTTEVIAQVLADVQQDDVYSLTISQATSRVYEESSSQAPKARVQPFCKSPIDTVAHSGDERHYIHTSSFCGYVLPKRI